MDGFHFDSSIPLYRSVTGRAYKVVKMLPHGDYIMKSLAATMMCIMTIDETLVPCVSTSLARE